MEIANYVDKVRLMGPQTSSAQPDNTSVVQSAHFLMSSITNKLRVLLTLYMRDGNVYTHVSWCMKPHQESINTVLQEPFKGDGGGGGDCLIGDQTVLWELMT